VEVFENLREIEYLSEEEEEIVKIECIICLEPACIFLVDFEYYGCIVGINRNCEFNWGESFSFCL
jgi:hypothetical protein